MFLHAFFSKQAVRHEATFDDLLPSISLHYDVTPDLRLKLAYAEGLGRPNPGDLGAAEYVADDGSLISGNPHLRPRRGRSYDLALERYFDQGRSLVALNLFRKTIDGEIYRYAAPEVIDGLPVMVERPRNAAPVTIDGAELSLSVRALPHLEGFGLAANATWIHGRTPARGLDGGERPLDFLPQQSEWPANLMVFYERARLRPTSATPTSARRAPPSAAPPTRTVCCWSAGKLMSRSAIS